MSRGHAYRDGHHGRSFRSRPGVGSATLVASLACSRYPKVGGINFSTSMPPADQIDQKFAAKGWDVRKRLCTGCRADIAAEKSKEKQMATTPSASAMKAQAKMFELLQTHFDKDKGAYEAGWSDARVATETGLSPAMVTQFRTAAFGELKEPPEIAALRSDIVVLAELEREHHGQIEQSIAEIRSRLAKISEQWRAA